MQYFVRGGINEVLGLNDPREENKILYSISTSLHYPLSNESKFVIGVVNSYGGV
jgi:hypothetical protein